MGLDMYLNRKIFIGKKKVKIVGLCDDYIDDVEKEMLGKEYDDVEELVIRAAYWRKANEIHEWLCQHLGDVENCCESVVSREVLKKLCDDCRKIMEEHNKGNRKTLARKLVPDPDGVYGDWYYEDIKRTLDMLDGKIEEDGEYVYYPWW